MATHLKINVFLLSCLLLLMVVMEEVKPALAKTGDQLKQRTKILEKTVKELNERMKEQEETMKALKECQACSKIKEINETLSALQEKTVSKPASVSSACQQYQSLTSGDRKYTNANPGSKCDSSIGPGWFRFEGDAGTKMPTSCVPVFRCGTNVAGWLTGGHPTVADGEVTGKVCFRYMQGCCEYSIDIKVKNCGAYYVYYFNSTPNNGQCDFRYCSTD